jgi:hypothetical protein
MKQYNRRHSIESIDENPSLKTRLDAFVRSLWLFSHTMPKDADWRLSRKQKIDICYAFANEYYDDDAAMDAYYVIAAYIGFVELIDEEDE